MKIKTFAKDEYLGYPIYYRNAGKHWECFVIINNELYTSQIQIKPHWVTKILYWLGLEQTMFSVQQQQSIIKILRALAEATINFKTTNTK